MRPAHSASAPAASQAARPIANGASAGPSGTAMKVMTIAATAAMAATASLRVAAPRLPRFHANSGPKAMAATSGTMIGAKVALK